MDFYENKFGWKLSELSNDKMILFQLNGILLTLYDKHKLAEDITVDSAGSGFKGFAISNLTKSEKEVDDLAAKLKK